MLIGDAAHNTPPTLGTGASSALQDTAILAMVADELLCGGYRPEPPSATLHTSGLPSSALSGMDVESQGSTLLHQYLCVPELAPLFR